MLLTLKTAAQVTYKLNVVNTDSATVFKKINYKKQFNNFDFVNKEINKIYLSLINEGFISASVDSLKNESLNYVAYISAGPKYKWVNLKYDKKDHGIVGKLGYGERFFSNRPFKFSELSQFMEKVVTYYENNGYPFASAKLDSLQISNSEINAKLSSLS